MKIYLGTDHRGYELKEKIFKWLIQNDYLVEDLGAYEYDPKDDYTLYASKVASVVGKDNNYRGILLCGSGVGVEVVANKFDGVRASIGKTPEQVRAGRKDDDMNILVIAADFTAFEEVKEMLLAFLKTKFSGEDRYIKRIEDIKKIEANN